ncbi:U5 small nuclear ribonucleoprotein TSSC4-like [Centroberyx affinis]|uniref:U5 small nuclear ribonucleoprotein TSSC4-like n=1 Tax=Centroberyx affinis TaxID=166261 RepID=UPI003A5B99CC
MCDQENGSGRDKTSARDDVTLPGNLSLSDDSEPEEEPTGLPFHTELKDSSSSDDDDDVGDGEVQIGGAAPAAGWRAQSSFSLKGGSSGFSSRSHSIFECLDSVAKLASSALGQDNVIDGVFARPAPPPPPPPSRPLPSSKTGRPPPSSSGPAGRRGVPDYVAHPERWTYYNLEDVAETSDRQNSAVARQFLTGLQQRKQQQEPLSPHLDQGQNTCGSQQKIIFSRPGRSGREHPVDEPKAAGGKERGMSLTHLEEEEEEEEEGVGVEGGRAMARRTSEFKEKRTEKAKERGKGISHLDQEDEEMGAAVRPPGAGERKRKWGQQGEGVEEAEEAEEEEEEEEEQQKKSHQASPGFVSFRKTNRKNYRKSTQQDDN